MLNIYNYSDYRKFISDYYSLKKSANPSFSYRYLSRKAGINSAPFFKFIIEGKRNLTKNTILKTCIALKLEDKEAEYFENLVFFNQSTTTKEKNHFFEKLIELQRLEKIETLTEDQYDFFSQWYHCVIRELAPMLDCRDNPGKLANSLVPAISGKNAGESLQLLKKLGLLDEIDGKYTKCHDVLTSGHSVRSHRIVQFQIQMLQLAIEAYDRSRVDERLMSSTTLSFNMDDFETIKKRIRELRSSLLELARTSNNPQKVYQLNINLFPTSKHVDRDTK